jgi:hypothetical protein
VHLDVLLLMLFSVVATVGGTAVTANFRGVADRLNEARRRKLPEGASTSRLTDVRIQSTAAALLGVFILTACVLELLGVIEWARR